MVESPVSDMLESLKQSNGEAAESNDPLMEDSLFLQALHALLSRMPDISDVKVIDHSGVALLTFSAVQPLVGRRPCISVPVAETTTLVGSSGSHSPIPTEVQAAIKGYAETLQRAGKPKPDLIVMALTDVKAPDRRRIESKLPTNVNSVAWVCGKDLFDHFERYYPEFLADEARALRKHASSIKAIAHDTTPVMKVAWLSGQPATAPSDPQFFVELTVQRTFSLLKPGDFFDPLPTNRRLRGNWTDQELGYLKAAIRHAMRFVAHATRWQYGAIDAKAAETLERKALQFVDQLEKAIEADYAELIASKSAKLAVKVTKKKTGRTAGSDRPGRAITSPTRLAELSSSLESVSEAWRTALATVRAEIVAPRAERLFAKAGRRSSVRMTAATADRTLSSLDFCEACRFDDFAMAAPERVVAKTGKFSIILPQPLLQSTTASLLIVGGPGSGKSSYCRWNALRDAERLALGEADTIPVLVPLHLVRPKGTETFTELFLSTAGNSGLLASHTTGISQRSRIRLYLDGLDEVPSRLSQRQITDLACAGTKEFPFLQVILTSRDHIIEPWLDWMPRVELGGLSSQQLEELANKWLGAGGDRFVAEAKGSGGLGSVITVPLLATLTILVFKHVGSLPSNRVGLYRMFTELLAGGWNLAKGVMRTTKYSKDAKIRVLSRAAYVAHNAQKKEFSYQSVVKAAKDEFGKRDDAVLDLVPELIADGLLEQVIGGQLQFRHFSFQEYLAARHLSGDPTSSTIRARLRDYMHERAGADWWTEVIRFFLEMSNGPSDAANWVREMGTELIDYNRCERVIGWIQDAFPETNI